MNQMEALMQYKTIVLELLKDRTEFHELLRKEKKLLQTMERHARELKASHEAWQEFLTQTRTGSSKTQIASEALEIATKELEDRLPFAFHPESQDPLFLDAAMLFTHRRHTSRA